jgi:hypothetical protein
MNFIIIYNQVLLRYTFVTLDCSLISRMLYTRWCMDTIDSSDDEHWVARNI